MGIVRLKGLIAGDWTAATECVWLLTVTAAAAAAAVFH